MNRRFLPRRLRFALLRAKARVRRRLNRFRWAERHLRYRSGLPLQGSTLVIIVAFVALAAGFAAPALFGPFWSWGVLIGYLAAQELLDVAGRLHRREQERVAHEHAIAVRLLDDNPL